MINLTFNDLSTVDHMTHISNLEGILSQGLLPHNNSFQKVDISNRAVNRRRDMAEPIYNKKIHDYVPFYFNARNAMLYANKDEHIVILGFNKKLISTDGALYTNGNAARGGTFFSNDEAFLESLDWDAVFSERWCSYGNYDESIKSKMMSELLIPNNVSIDDLEVIFCESEEMKTYIMDTYSFDANIEVAVTPHLFF